MPSSKPNRATVEARTERWRQSISTTKIIKRLKDHGDGKVELTPTQIKAYEVLLSRTVPTLASVEQTVVNENDRLSEQDLTSKMLALVTAKPELLELIGRLMKAAQQPGQQPLDVVVKRPESGSSGLTH